MTQEIYRKYALVLLKAASNLKPGEILMVNASPRDYLFVREITRAAYEMGAKYVKVDYADDYNDVLRCRLSREEDLDYYPQWLSRYLGESGADNIAMISLYNPNPTRNEGLDDSRVLRMHQAEIAGREAFARARADGHVSWVKTCIPCPEWAAKVYPELPADEALARLWDNIIQVVRLDADDPVQAWIDHKNTIRAKKEKLNALDLRTLYFSGPGTDLEIGLVDKGTWVGGYDINQKDQSEYIPNVPTEELFYVPHKYQINGTVRATLPLNYNGTIIRDFGMTIQDGKVIEYHAGEGEQALRGILEHDEGSCYFGEIALVPVQSPIYQIGRVFYDTLLDENAVCHIALGNAPASVVEGGSRMDPQQRDRIGINVSKIHVDFMIGSAQTNVDALTRDGQRVAIMREGDWVL